MKEHTQTTGIRKWAGDDLIELQKEPLDALQALVEPYAPCIIQGCVPSPNEDGKYTVSPGFVALKGKLTKEGEEEQIGVKIVRFEGKTDVLLPLYLGLECKSENRAYADGGNKPIKNVYVAKELSKDTGDDFCLTITVNDSANPHLVDTLGITQKLDRKEAQKGIVSYTKDLAEKHTNIESGSTLGTLFGKIERWLGDLSALAFKEKVAKNDLDFDLDAELGKKVDKDGDKGLVKVDTSLNESSPNPVQNKVIEKALKEKLSLSGGTISGKLEVTEQLTENGQRVYSPNNKPTLDAIGAAASGHTHSYLPLSGGTMTGPITYNTASGTSKTNNYISAGGGYGTGSGKYGLKLLAVDQNDCQGGIGADLTGGSYELTVATGKNPSNTNTECITFAKHAVNSKTYTKLAEIDGSGNFNAVGQIKENGTRVYSPNNKPTAVAVGALPSTGGTISGNLNVAGQITENGTHVYSPNNIPTPAEIGVAEIVLGNGMSSSSLDSMCKIPKSGILGNKFPKVGDTIINVSYGLMTIGKIVKTDLSNVYVKLSEALQVSIS